VAGPSTWNILFQYRYAFVSVVSNVLLEVLDGVFNELFLKIKNVDKIG